MLMVPSMLPIGCDGDILFRSTFRSLSRYIGTSSTEAFRAAAAAREQEQHYYKVIVE
jgi:hypothetical protein